MFSDLGRPGLHAASLRRALVGHAGVWTDLRVVQQTGSTNDDVAELARRGTPSGLVLVAESQVAGRGRLDRPWSAPPRSGLTFSVLLRPSYAVPPARWGWFPLLAGLAVASPLARLSGLDVRLKWPNDLLVGERKLAGILAQRVDDALVIGIGINVSLTDDELPVPTATSLLVEGSEVEDRDPVLRAVLRSLADRYAAFEQSGGDVGPLREEYLTRCATIGRNVRVQLPGERILEGEAVDVDDDGRLVVSSAGARRVLAAGDVVHVR